MVDLFGGRNCVQCGTAATCSFIPRLRPALRHEGDRHKPVQREFPRACKDDADGPGSGIGLSAGSPVQKNSTRRHRGGLATAVHFACNDAMLMSAAAQNLDERARSDVAILARGISRLDMRARRDLALIGSGFQKLDARAREDTEKLDSQARRKVQRLRRVALGLQEIARLEAEEHWSDGALDADLRLADLRARRRVMEDAFVSVQALKNFHNAMVSILRLREIQSRPHERSDSLDSKNAANHDTRYTTGNAALDRLLELEEAYLSMVSLLSEGDGIDCMDPDELEFVVAALLDMDEVAGGNGASLLAECATSPDVATRRALADALAGAPSLWTLGNAGMGALQRLAMDSNPAVAAAATKAIEEFNEQWMVEDQSTLFYPGIFPPLDKSELEDKLEDI